jgi:hypothetical protein
LSGGSEEEPHPLLVAHGYRLRDLHRNPSTIYIVLAE